MKIATILLSAVLAVVLHADTITETATVSVETNFGQFSTPSGVEEACPEEGPSSCFPITLDLPQIADIQGPVTWTFTDTQQYLFVYDGSLANTPGMPLGSIYTTTEGDTSQVLDLIASATQQNVVTVDNPGWQTNQFQESGTLDSSLLEGNGTLSIQIRPSCYDFAEIECIVIDDMTLTATFDSPVPEPRWIPIAIALVALGVGYSRWMKRSVCEWISTRR